MVEATNQNSFKSFKKKYPKKFCKNPLSVLYTQRVSDSFKVGDSKINSICDESALRETGFTGMCALKTRYQNRFKVETDQRLCLSRVTPRLQKLTNGKQAQLSHL